MIKSLIKSIHIVYFYNMIESNTFIIRPWLPNTRLILYAMVLQGPGIYLLQLERNFVYHRSALRDSIDICYSCSISKQGN